jgi:hypothetical protein
MIMDGPCNTIRATVVKACYIYVTLRHRGDVVRRQHGPFTEVTLTMDALVHRIMAD